jgi:DNA-binding MarR family transcriptional regulator
VLNRAADIYLTRRLEEFGLGPGQQAYLLTLSGEEGATQDEVARRHRVDKANAARALQKLERLGYVVRRRNPADRRERLVVLTPSGVRIRSAVQSIMEDWIATLRSTVSDLEWDTTLAALEKMSGAAMAAARVSITDSSVNPELRP